MTRVVLDPPVVAGDVAVAAVCWVRMTHWRVGHGFGVAGDKRALALLVRRGETVTALGLDGAALDPAEVEALCPGALDRVRRA